MNNVMLSFLISLVFVLLIFFITYTIWFWHQRIKIKFILKWYDAWIGFYFNQADRRVYFFLLPMIGISMEKYKEVK